MTGKIIAAFACWLIALLGIGAVTFYNDSQIGLGCVIVLIMLPIATFLINLVIRKQISAWIRISPVMSKKGQIQGIVTVKNESWIPIAQIYGKISLVNQLTRENSESTVVLSAASKTQTEQSFTVSASHCGYIQISISRLYLMDWFGFLPVFCQAKAKASVSVLPDTFSPNIFLNMSMACREDADAWSPVRKGNDQTEVFSLRDYVEGDSLRQIHWKLSSKRQHLIVREPSLPVEKSLLIFWDKNVGQPSAEDMDAMAECAASVAQKILYQGTSFTLGWTDGKINFMEDIETEDQMIQAIPRMIKWGTDTTSGSGAFLYAQTGNRHDFGKVIYIAKTFPEDFEPFSDGDMTLILCDRNAAHPLWPVVFFDAETYLTDLETIEL